MSKTLLLIAIATTALVACGKPTSNGGSPDSGHNGSADSGNNGTVANNGGTIPGTNGTNGTDACADIGARFTDAVRAIPRDCTTDADCKTLPRAQVCDCDLAVSASSDTAAYDSVRAEADAARCANPFGCPSGECPYRRLSATGDIVPHCNDEGQCETLQIMSCDDYQAKAQGGVANPGSCEADADCALRNDLNPCDCNEAITRNFPFLTVEAIYEMIAINDARCGGTTCGGCPMPAGVTCATDSEGQKYCAAQ